LSWCGQTSTLSRLHDKVRGRVIVVAHRVSENDLSSHLLAEQGWTYLLLPLVAVRRRTYKLGHGEWVREKGDVLRPSAYPTREIERLRRTQLEPPFELFHQQGLGAQGSLKIRREHFQSFEEFQLPIGPVVLSIDPGFDSGLKASRSVIQAWKPHGKQHYLLGEFCQQCDADELRRAFWFFVKKWHPSIALIEDTANGPALYSAVRRKARFELRRVKPGEAKAVRFDRHRRKIRTGKIFLPALAAWRTEFIEELVAFPGDFDDRVDAMTQYLDFADAGERLTLPPARFNGLVLLASNYPGRRR
jgi:predicted phage terminase large subunit-like protein